MEIEARGDGELGAVGVGRRQRARERDEELELQSEDGFFFEESASEKENAEKTDRFDVETIDGGVLHPLERLLRGCGLLRLDLHERLSSLALFPFL